MELGLIRKVDIDSEMQQSYLDYAMSVIVARALPDARDGLKPVQRRVLYAMYDMGLRADSTYKKSARIVGEVLGKYHPHGDVAVYESMARLAQDFTMRYGLVAGQGNFGSVDGDPPAAMRYTEARLSPFAMEMLNQIERDTVDFTANFDGTLSEPVVLPAAAPNLLVNGASGIAVGMATSIPPHNLTEVIDALVLMLHEWDRLDELTISDLMKFVQGPDFPTGGIILQENGQDVLLQAYATGRGRVKVRGRVQKEDMERGKSRLIISELPYQVNKSSLIERIADLVRENVIEGIADLRDESDRQGMRIVIELKAGTDIEPVLLKLYHRTPLESTFGISLLALVDGEPRLLSLKQALRVYLGHRLEVIQRRSEFDLAKARARAHILEGLRIALANLDEIIALIKASPDAEQARTRLIKRFKLTELQAQAILDMQLRRLASLERKKIEQEYKDLTARIKELVALLKSPGKMRQAVEVELLEIKDKYGDKRRTRIVALKEGESAKELLTTKDMTPALPVWIGIMEDGTIGRAHEDALPRVSGRAAPRWLLHATTHHTLYLAAEDGHAAAVAVEAIPNVENFTDGVPFNKISPLEPGDILSAAITLPPHSEIEGEVYMMTTSRMGMIKKSAVADLPGPSTQRFILTRINDGDTLGWVFLTDGKAEILLVSANGMAIRFSEADVRPMGLVAAGVNGMKLLADDRIIGADQLVKGLEVLTIADNGKGWRLSANEFPVQGRYGQGVQLCKLEPGSQLAGILVGKRTQTGMIHYKQAAAKSVRVDAIRLVKRQRVGQELSAVKTGDAVLDITSILDGLSFWEKSAPTSRRRSTKKKAQVEEMLAVATQEETQVQASLPGMDATARTGSKPSARKPGTRAKAAPSKDGKRARSSRTSAAKASAGTRQKQPASEAPLLQPGLSDKPETAAKAPARRRAKTAAATGDDGKATISQEKSVKKPAGGSTTRRSRTKAGTTQAAAPEKSTRTTRQTRKSSTKAAGAAQPSSTTPARRTKKAPQTTKAAPSAPATTSRRSRSAAKAVEQAPAPSPAGSATRVKRTSRRSSAAQGTETSAQDGKKPTRARSTTRAAKPDGNPATNRRKTASKGKNPEEAQPAGESGQTTGRRRAKKTPTEKPAPPEVHGWEQVDIPPVIQPDKSSKPAKRRSSKK